jgi:hypothetical protein
MTRKNHNALKSISFYLIAVLVIVFINVSGEFKSGPCTPNLDLLSFFLLGPLIVILMVINGILAFVMDKSTKHSFYIHLFALSTWMIILLR